ncbi:MAG TPA: type II secretion system F family protein [Dissulfurispiraceae bacterium]
MSVFSYRAASMDGVITEGFIEAPDETAALQRIKASGVIPIKVGAHKEEGHKRFSLKSSKGDLLIFTTELSALLGAGLPLDRSLGILIETLEHKEMKGVVQSMLRAIREGSSFSDALQKHPQVFPKLYANMVRAGETGGVLDTVLDKLNEFLESSQELKEHIFSAMIYPVVLLLTGGASVIVLLTYVLPKFTVIFADLGASLPLPTQILLAVSNALQSYWWVCAAGAAAGWIGLKNYTKSEEGRYKLDALKLKLMRDVIIKVEVARFARTLGTLLRSGVPLLQALNNSRDIIGNRVIARAVTEVSKGAKEGKGIAAPLASSGVFPQLALSMIKVGEETGQLDTMLLKVASTYEKNLRAALKKLISFLEPVMILGMGVVIGFIVISMLMAIFSITDLPF